MLRVCNCVSYQIFQENFQNRTSFFINGSFDNSSAGAQRHRKIQPEHPIQQSEKDSALTFPQPRAIHIIFPKTAALDFKIAAIGTVFFGYALFLEEKFWCTTTHDNTHSSSNSNSKK